MSVNLFDFHSRLPSFPQRVLLEAQERATWCPMPKELLAPDQLHQPCLQQRREVFLQRPIRKSANSYSSSWCFCSMPTSASGGSRPTGKYGSVTCPTVAP